MSRDGQACASASTTIHLLCTQSQQQSLELINMEMAAKQAIKALLPSLCVGSPITDVGGRLSPLGD